MKRLAWHLPTQQSIEKIWKDFPLLVDIVKSFHW